VEFPIKRYFSLAYAGYDQAVDGYLSIFKAPFAGTVTAAYFMPAGAITGHATVRRDLNLIKWDALGQDSQKTVATLDFVLGVDATQQVELEFTLSSTVANLDLAETDYLHLHSDAVGGGVADPGGLIIVEFTRDLSDE
jgi:hypothetical protein